jgi:hypothetical protein
MCRLAIPGKKYLEKCIFLFDTEMHIMHIDFTNNGAQTNDLQKSWRHPLHQDRQACLVFLYLKKERLIPCLKFIRAKFTFGAKAPPSLRQS